MSRGQFIGGKEVEQFERAIARYCGVEFAVSLNSGTDALVYALSALGIGPGDEVITPPNSFVASTAAIYRIGARPVFSDVGSDQNIDPSCIESLINKKTRAIMPVHLTGRVSAMPEINELAEKYNLKVIEDAAQAIGSELDGKRAGTLGTVGCFSTHPLKNLNACGDGGFVTTNNRSIADQIRIGRNHGIKDRDTVLRFGHVSRLDAIQAAILSYRLKHLPRIIEKRRTNASIYLSHLNLEHVFVPKEKEGEFNTYHTFVIQAENRDELQNHLRLKGIETAVHYPIPIHLQPAAASLGYSIGDFVVCEAQARRNLSIPIHQYLVEKDVQFVADAVNDFYST